MSSPAPTRVRSPTPRSCPPQPPAASIDELYDVDALSSINVRAVAWYYGCSVPLRAHALQRRRTREEARHAIDPMGGGKTFVMRNWVRDHGLLLANLALFAVFLVGMVLAGAQTYNAEQALQDQSTVSLWGYLSTGNVVEATFENWESEFLQMGMYVVLTVYLFQRGSAESKPINAPTPQDADPREADKRKPVPWPVRRGGWVLALYENSLSLLFFLLFAISIALHAIGGARDYSDELSVHGRSAVTVWQYVGTSRFWFESFQNWQSEFLAVAVLVGASVYLRQRGSPESRPVAESHHVTGADPGDTALPPP